MSVSIRGNTNATQAEVESSYKALRVTQRPIDPGSNGAFRICAPSGLLTGVAAATASAGHVFAFRWSHATKKCVIENIRCTWATISGFTAAQEVGLDLIRATNYTANHSGGTSVTLTGVQLKKNSAFTTTQAADIRIGSTGALTAGTHTLDSLPMAQNAFSELATGAAVPKGFFTLQWSAGSMHPLVLNQNEGLVIRNSILMGAGGTARIFVSMDWSEVDSY